MAVNTKILMRLIFGIIASSLCSCANAEAKSTWTSIRVIVYENRNAGEQLDCSTQHIREHIYARVIHKSLDDQSRWPFVVDAKSTLDKIIISIDILANISDRSSIVSVLDSGLKSKPSLELIASELQLVAIEEKAVLARPPLSERLLRQLSKTFGQKLVSDCQALPSIEPNGFDFGPEMGRYQIAIFDGSKLPNIALDVADSRSVVSYKRGIYEFPASPVANENDANAESPIDALYIGLIDGQEVEDHIVVIASIANAARKGGVKSPVIRPLGIGAFVVLGQYEELNRLRAELAGHVKSDMDSPLERAMLVATDQWAQKFFCATPQEIYPTAGGLADAIVAHPYFPFWLEAPECKDKNVSKWPFRAHHYAHRPNIHLEFLSSAAFKYPAYKVANLKYSMCVNFEQQNLPSDINRKIILRALRQHFRMDLGLVLDIREKDLNAGCSTVGFIAPVENHIALKKAIKSLDINDAVLKRRISDSMLEFFCQRQINIKCDDNQILIKTNIPKNLFSLKPL